MRLFRDTLALAEAATIIFGPNWNCVVQGIFIQIRERLTNEKAQSGSNGHRIYYYFVSLLISFNIYTTIIHLANNQVSLDFCYITT